ncbi:hypothetical protein ACS0TY_026150 [Phlomoides rotata]
MKVNVVSRKLVKPWKETPPQLRCYKISLMDEINPSMHVIRILYYSSSSDHHVCTLEDSLTQILPLFYPLAGRYDRENHQVDCNDKGAEYSTALVDCQLHQLIAQTKLRPEHLNHLLPLEIGASDEPTDPLLALQINRFQCGGLAIGACASHRIFDSASLGIFLAAWANAAMGKPVISPNFDSPSYFPPDNLRPHQFQESRTLDESIVSRRYIFDKNAISRLRGMLETTWKSNGIEVPPSRVVTVSAVLSQALLRADRAKHGKSRSSLIGQVINVRERTIPPLSKHSCGTWVVETFLEFTAEESQGMDKNFAGMALKMRDVIVQGVRDCARILSDKEFGRWLIVDMFLEGAKKAESPDYKAIFITDFSKFGEYEVDFGFGKPVWISMAAVPLEDHFILLNTKNNDGIEAWVYLHESDMPFFEQDEDLRMLTSISA